jgi:hypothetical protein
LHVPIQCVVRENGQPTVYVMENGEAKPRAVKLGMDNNNRVHILEGLKEKEMVLAAPPIKAGSEPISDSPALQQAATAPSRQLPPAAAGPNGAQARATTGPSTGPAGAVADASNDWSAMRQQFQNMTPEERTAAIQKRMESMTPEQRAQFEARRGQRRYGGGGEGGGGRGPQGAQ